MDSFVLNGPNGSSINVASFVLADPGPDFGEAELLKANFSENPANEGGVLAFETANIRRMQFPLRVASIGQFGGAAGLQSWLRMLARPGATLDLQLDGVPSSEAVRFDIAAGRFEVGPWDTRMYSQTDRFEGTLKLDVQPFGYWPTLITLASSASVGLPGSLDIPASVIGDVPGLAVLAVQPTVATQYSSGTWQPDLLGWSLAGRPSMTGFLMGGSWGIFGVGAGAGTVFVDSFAPKTTLTVGGPTVLQQIYGPGAATTWTGFAYWQVASSLEPAFRGLFRAFAYVKWSPSTVLKAQLTADVVPDTAVLPDRPIGSAAQVATIVPNGGGSMFVAPSPAYQLVDLGLQQLPAMASGQGNTSFLRLWFNAGTNTTATTTLTLGGVHLLPMDGPAGVLPYGLAQPSIYSAQKDSKFVADAVSQNFLHTRTVAGDLGTALSPDYDLLTYHRGVFPRVGASTTRLNLIAGSRKWSASGATAPVVHSAPMCAAAAVKYVPRFVFMRGL